MPATRAQNQLSFDLRSKFRFVQDEKKEERREQGERREQTKERERPRSEAAAAPQREATRGEGFPATDAGGVGDPATLALPSPRGGAAATAPELGGGGLESGPRRQVWASTERDDAARTRRLRAASDWLRGGAFVGEGGTDLSVAPTFAGGGSATRSPSYTPLSASGVAAYHRCPRVPFHCQTAERKTLRYRRENLALALFSRRYLMRE